jgi:hypothetical protein
MAIYEEFFSAAVGTQSPPSRVRLVALRRTYEQSRRRRNHCARKTMAEKHRPSQGVARRAPMIQFGQDD